MKKKTGEREFVLLKDIVIPRGTRLERMPENKGGIFRVGCVVGIGRDFTGDFSMTVTGIEDADGWITELEKRV